MTPEQAPRDRALAIIAAFGADSRRWPAEEREAARLAAIADPVVAAALAEARSLDALLGDWAHDVRPGSPLDAAALIPAAQPEPLRPRRWWAGAAIAAAVTGLIVVRAPVDMTTGGAPVQIATATSASVSPHVSPASSAAGESEILADSEAFATVFTPTTDEDQLI